MVIQPTNSDLLFTRADGTQAFTHDTNSEYFLAVAEFFKIQQASSQSVAIGQAYSRLVSRSNELAGPTNSLWIHGDNLEQRTRSQAEFLDEMIRDEISHPVIQKLLDDSFLNDVLEIKEMYCAGDNSRIIIAFNPMTTIYDPDTTSKDLIKLYHHFAHHYGMNLFLLSSAISLLDPQRLNFFPEDRELTLKLLHGLMRRGVVKPLELFLLEPENNVTCVGVEDMDCYKQLADLDYHRVKLGEENSSRLVETYVKRSYLIARNSVKRLDEFNAQVVLLDHFYNGTLGKLNPYHFLEQGVSYVFLEPKSKPNFDLGEHHKRMIDYEERSRGAHAKS